MAGSRTPSRSKREAHLARRSRRVGRDGGWGGHVVVGAAVLVEDDHQQGVSQFDPVGDAADRIAS